MLEPHRAAGGRRRLGTRLALAALLAVALLAGANLLSTSPAQAATRVVEAAAAPVDEPAQTWSMNLYQPNLLRFQDPDPKACTAAATMSMLNLIAYDAPEVMPVRNGGRTQPQLIWQVDTSYARQNDILKFERDHMTLGIWNDGTDPHGWRNALNWYGWGSLTAGVYRDTSFDKWENATWTVVASLARTSKPVGILGWSGGHAQFVTGYKVTGGDPRVSDNFRIDAVYLTDPWRPDAARNQLIAYQDWRTGPSTIRFGRYWQKDYSGRDPIDGQIGTREWRGNFVIEQPLQ